MNIAHDLEMGKGFSLDLKFLPQELKQVNSLVREHWLNNIKQVSEEIYEQFYNIEMRDYHQFSHLLDHGNLWCKANRILPDNIVNVIKQTSLFNALEGQFGPFSISNEEGIRQEEIYWRLVRPNQANDMGPLHADAWFWDLGHGVMPPNSKRVKVWVALHCEPGLNGLRLVPHSQKKEWKYHGEYRDGLTKPQLDEKEDDLEIKLMHTQPGDAVVFHDKLLHGGAPNLGQHTRVSMEFTLIIAR